MLGTTFYHSIIRKYISLFGTLFSDMYISRTLDNEEIQRIKVPLSYASKDKLLGRLFGDPEIQREAAVVLPRMSFEMKAPMYDSHRLKMPLNRIPYCANTADPNSLQVMYEPVPYVFPFVLWVYGNNPEDCAQIVEQIYPRFRPEWTFSISPLEAIPTLKLDHPLTMTSSNVEDSYYGPLSGNQERRRVVWTFEFALSGYMFGPVMTKPLIKYVIGNAKLYGNTETIEGITVQPGLTANGEPTSNVEISIPVDDIKISDPYGYVKIYTGSFE